MPGRSSASRIRAREQCLRLAPEVRLARATLAMTSQQVAARAGVSWSTVARVQLGDPGTAIDTVAAVAEAVGLELVLRAYPGRQPSLRDSGQLALAEELVRQLGSAWQPALEVPAGEHGQATDLVLFGAQEIITCEIERMAVDLQAQYRCADRKRRLLSAAHRRPVRLVLLLEDTRRNRAAVEPHLPALQSLLPAATREVLAGLRGGRPVGRDGLVWLRQPRREPRTALQRRE